MSFDFQAVLQETVQKRQYFLYKFNETQFLLHVGAECQEQCSDGELGKTALKAVDKLLLECTDAFTAFVFKIINQKTVAYVAKCRPNDTCGTKDEKISMKASYLPYPNRIGNEFCIRGRVSGADAIKFLQKIRRDDLLKFIVC